METSPIEILVLEHGQESQLALFGEWATSRRHVLSVVKAHELESWPSPDDWEAVVSFGSNSSVVSPQEPWIAQEVQLLRAAHSANIPVLGICFGAQAMAVGLGGGVVRGPDVKIGWEPPSIHDPDLIPPGPWFRWHEDILSVPPAARELAQAGNIPLAFELGRSIALQFHPEVEVDLVCKWIASARDRAEGLPIAEDLLLEETEKAAVGAPARAAALFDAVVRRWRCASNDASHI